MNAPCIMEPAIKTRFEIGGVTLLQGDARDLCQKYTGQANLVLSDPPYMLTSGGRPKKGGKHKVMAGIFSPDAYDNSGKLMDVPSWSEIAEVISILGEKDAEAYVMANDKNIFPAYAELSARRWKLHNLLVWDKVHAIPNRWYMKHLEFVLYMWKGRARAVTNPSSKQLAAMHAPRRGEGKIHPTQKPVDLLRQYIINSISPEQLVIDPYSGSAATLVAAAVEGRRAVGFEKSEAHFNAAAARLTAMFEAMPQR